MSEVMTFKSPFRTNFMIVYFPDIKYASSFLMSDALLPTGNTSVKHLAVKLSD